MRTWPKDPVIYEINTWVWLRELGQKYRESVDLSMVPEQEWDAIAAQGFDAVWFMGVWERSPAGIEISMRNELRRKEWRLNKVLSGESFGRSGNDMRDGGLYVDLGPWKCHLFQGRSL